MVNQAKVEEMEDEQILMLAESDKKNTRCQKQMLRTWLTKAR